MRRHWKDNDYPIVGIFSPKLSITAPYIFDLPDLLEKAGMCLLREAGKIYGLSDQLPAALGMGGTFPNAFEIACSHKCVPIGEGHLNIDALFKERAAA